jgi:ABC-2 type transport system permease protein
MNAAEPAPPPAGAPAPSPGKTLRRLFLTLFLRGRSSRGLQKQGAPKSVGRKLALTLLFYMLFGLFALVFVRQPVFALAVYLHGMTFVFLGMFIASSAGEILFNKEEADILLHRPIDPQTLLWAKVRVLLEVSLWLAGAFNLTGLLVGLVATGGGWRFPVAHAISTALEALFCTGCVVMLYQLCLRWFGRERLEGLMTTAQVIASVTLVLAGQFVPQLMTRLGGRIQWRADTWWVGLLPPAWFAGFDDVLGGEARPGSWLLALLGLAATGAVAKLAFGKLARDYQAGLQTLSEAVPPRRPRGAPRRRLIDVLVHAPPLRWWLREPVARASFLLSWAYLVRDRDVKLRVYPGIAPLFVMPFIFLIQDPGGRGSAGSGFGVAFAGAYLGLAPLLGVNLLRYSQQWAAADVFRAAPLPGPAALSHGARRAVLVLFTMPLLAVFGVLSMLMAGDPARLLLLLPGLIMVPLYALVPCLGGKAVPLSAPTEEAKSAGRGLTMIGVMMVSMALAGLAAWAWAGNWFGAFLLAESVAAGLLYVGLRQLVTRARWSPME